MCVVFFFKICFFGQEACGILPPCPGIKPTFPALEGEILTTGPPEVPWFSFIHDETEVQGEETIYPESHN